MNNPTTPNSGAPKGAPALTMETINCEPDWQVMFSHAIRIAKTEIDPSSGQQLIVEMLEFGKRLEEAAAHRLAADLKEARTQERN